MGEYSSGWNRADAILAQRWVIVRCSPRWKGAVRGRNDSLPSGTGVGTREPYRCAAVGLRIDRVGSSDPTPADPTANRDCPHVTSSPSSPAAPHRPRTDPARRRAGASRCVRLGRRGDDPQEDELRTDEAGLVALRLDTRLAAIARDRSQYQARTGDADHTQGSKDVFDFINAAGIKWYAAGEIIAQNRYYPSVEDSAAAAIKGWLGSSTHRSILLSKGYNYVGFGYAMNPDNQRRYWTGVFMKGPDRTAPWPRSRASRSERRGGYIAVTIRWDGATAGCRSSPPGSATSRSSAAASAGRGRRGGRRRARRTVRWFPNRTGEFRVRSRQGRQLEQMGYRRISL